MEENEYRETYHEVNERRCAFEKAVHSRRCSCSKAQRIHIADREGISCKSAAGNALCKELLRLMRTNARFALHVTDASHPLPHAKEIRVQTGGMLGLQGLIYPDRQSREDVDDIIAIVDASLQRYGSLEDLPFQILVQGIVSFEGRGKRGHRRGDS